MEDATLKQARKLLDLAAESKADSRQLQDILPYFAILLKANTAEMNKDEYRKACRLKVSQSPKPKLLELLDTIRIPATTKKFVAKKKFVINTGDDAVVKISFLEDNFKAEFLDKVEKPFLGSELRRQKLKKSSVDGPIIDELGGEAKAETTLAEVFALMEKQGKGESGTLLTNGYANIFYVCNANGVLRAVDVHWHGDDWSVDAYSVESPDRWYVGYQVFSRNS